MDDLDGDYELEDGVPVLQSLGTGLSLADYDPLADAGSGECGDCTCCSATGCHRGGGADCPTDVLGDSVCPCTQI